jgi:hypothetical protein
VKKTYTVTVTEEIVHENGNRNVYTLFIGRPTPYGDDHLTIDFPTDGPATLNCRVRDLSASIEKEANGDDPDWTYNSQGIRQ